MMEWIPIAISMNGDEVDQRVIYEEEEGAISYIVSGYYWSGKYRRKKESGFKLNEIEKNPRGRVACCY